MHIAQQILLNSHVNTLFKNGEYNAAKKAVAAAGMPASTTDDHYD
ncbi:MAG: hypothetical protein ACJA2J_001595 [Candidatus Azotimanducaceae bacterium]|jgi:hypothetical protein